MSANCIKQHVVEMSSRAKCDSQMNAVMLTTTKSRQWLMYCQIDMCSWHEVHVQSRDFSAWTVTGNSLQKWAEQLIWQVLSLQIAHQSAHSAGLLPGKAPRALNPMSAHREAACHSSVSAGRNLAAHLELPNRTPLYLLQNTQSHEHLLVWHSLVLLQYWHLYLYKSKFACPKSDTSGHPPASAVMGLTEQILTAW